MEQSPKHSPVTFLWFCYLSAILTIIVFLTLAQVVIQLSLSQAMATRQIATEVHRQELKSQKLLRNAILLLVPASRAEATKELKVDVPQWENWHRDLETLALAKLVMSDHIAIDEHYHAMDTALRALLLDETKHYTSEKEHARTITPEIGQMFYHEIPNITALDVIFTRINAQADIQVIQVRVVEALLYGLTLVVMAIEFFVVITPARRSLTTASQEEGD